MFFRTALSLKLLYTFSSLTNIGYAYQDKVGYIITSKNFIINNLFKLFKQMVATPCYTRILYTCLKISNTGI
jgi:hypothetical protein